MSVQEKLREDQAKPEMIPVQSSNIAAISFAPGPEGKPGSLYVEFTSGGCYAYHSVPAETFEQMRDAPSKGAFLAKVIKGTYEARKVK